MKPHIVLLDNVDSFTYNLVDELRTLGYELIIYRNYIDAQTIYDHMVSLAQSHDVMLMLSPGPGNPTQAGCMMTLLEKVTGQFPVLGICLGHQAIVESFGGRIVRAGQVMHGKSSLINHHHEVLFANLPQPLPVARYHSLMAENMPAELSVLAEVDDIPMAVYHDKYNMLGFQFHPESVLTAQGSQLLAQSIRFLLETHNHTNQTGTTAANQPSTDKELS